MPPLDLTMQIITSRVFLPSVSMWEIAINTNFCLQAGISFAGFIWWNLRYFKRPRYAKRNSVSSNKYWCVHHRVIVIFTHFKSSAVQNNFQGFISHKPGAWMINVLWKSRFYFCLSHSVLHSIIPNWKVNCPMPGLTYLLLVRSSKLILASVK